MEREGAAAPFHLVLAEPSDRTAMQVARALMQAGEPVEIVTPAELMMAPHWSHDPFGDSLVRLASGVEITAGRLSSVLNRVQFVHPVHFAGSSPANQSYAAEEYFALLVSWLTGFGAQVSNPPHPGFVAGYKPFSPLEDRLELADPQGTDRFAAASRSGLLGRMSGQSGYPEPEAPVMPASPAMDPGGPDRGRVLVAGARLSRPDPPEALVAQIRAAMARRNLTLAAVTFGDGGLRTMDPLPQCDCPEEIALIAAHLIDIARQERTAA